MSINSISIKKLVLAYFACIVVFSVIYYFSPQGSLNQELTLVNAVYFSVVTITTLGYGDILPTSWLAQIIISIQTLLGLFILGLLINAAWSNYAQKVENETKKSLKNQTLLTNDKKLKSYTNAISWVFINMRHSFFEVTTPISNREDNSWSFDSNFQIKNLAGMFDISLRYKNGFNTSIEAFYDNEDALVSELKFILANFELDHHEDLQNSIVEYIGLHLSDHARGALLLNVSNDAEKIKNLIINHEQGDQFKEEFKPILNPVIIFSLSLEHKYKLMSGIHTALNRINTDYS